ncbi:uncharacterized protein [Prorops nasuta]|uniref:uncharacterized protein n=1 Tax=Prorops nasuta TaxID=863751 RepID=UPI0034CFEF1B
MKNKILVEKQVVKYIQLIMFTCSMCSSRFVRIADYDKHQIIHKYSPGLRIICRYRNCSVVFNKYINFKMHIFRWHTNKLLHSAENIKYVCKEARCQFECSDRKLFNRHLYDHIRKGKHGIICDYCNCPAGNKIFNKLNTFKSHVHRWHSIEFPTNRTQKYPTEAINRSNFTESHSDNCNEYLGEEEIVEFDNKNNEIKSIAELLITLTIKHSLSEIVLQSILETISAVINISNQNVLREILNLNLPEDSRLKLIHCINDSLICKTLQSQTGCLRNSYQRNRYFHKNFNVVMPIIVQLGLNNFYKEAFFHYTGNNTLKIILYQDSFELCNPLGSASKKYKITAVYMTLGNLPSHLLSKIDNIHLVLLCVENNIKYFGWEKVLQLLIHDLTVLEKDGITINVNYQKITFFGTVVAVLGDNLGSHQVGGFTENFSNTLHFCRFCYITKTQLLSCVYGNKKKRSIDNYNNDVLAAESTESIVNGIKRLPPCIAHDLFEGIVPFDLMFAIKYFVSRKWFTFTFFNYRLHKIKHCDIKNLIPDIPNNADRLKGTASQIRNSLLIFPLLVFDKINDTEDNVWIMVMLLSRGAMRFR